MTFLTPLSVVKYKMVIKWTRTARECLTRISSERFTIEETMVYKRHIVKEIERKILFMMEVTPSKEPEWRGTYRILVGNYKVYYSFSEDMNHCYIEGLKHQHQK